MARQKGVSWKPFLSSVCEGEYSGIPSVFCLDVVYCVVCVRDTVKYGFMFMRKVCCLVMCVSVY